MRIVEAAEMGIGDDLDADRGGKARLVVQCALGAFDRLLKASRREMSDRQANGVPIAERIERAQTLRPIDGFDRRLGMVAQRV